MFIECTPFNWIIVARIDASLPSIPQRRDLHGRLPLEEDTISSTLSKLGK
jgi:hypothetical protein